MPAWRFAFAPAPPAAGLVLPRSTAMVMAGLTPALVRAITRWAPPVVSLSETQAGDGVDQPIKEKPDPVPVFGNIVSAFLAQHLTPERKVWVRVLKVATQVHVSVQELAAAGAPLLTPVVARHRERIIRAAPTAQLAGLVTGLQRAMVFRIRRGTA